MILHNVGNSWGVGRGTRPATPDGIVDLGQLVRDSVGNIGACGGARIGSKNDSVAKGDGHAVEVVRVCKGRSNRAAE